MKKIKALDLNSVLNEAIEALRFYGEKINYDSGDVPGHIYVEADKGSIARNALESIEGLEIEPSQEKYCNSSEKRRVKYFEHNREWVVESTLNNQCLLSGGRGVRKYVKTKHKGYFLAFGTGSEEIEYGCRTYSTAIIEKDNGEVVNVPVENVQFIN